MQIYEARLRDDKRGVNLISDAFPFGGLSTSTIAFAYAQQRQFFYARRCAANRFARRQMDVDSRSAFAILSAASARNVAP
jgi:hypothetical protein